MQCASDLLRADLHPFLRVVQVAPRLHDVDLAARRPQAELEVDGQHPAEPRRASGFPDSCSDCLCQCCCYFVTHQKAGQIQSPHGFMIMASTYPYLKEKDGVVLSLPLVIGFKMLLPSPTREHPYQLLFVQYSPS